MRIRDICIAYMRVLSKYLRYNICISYNKRIACDKHIEWRILVIADLFFIPKLAKHCAILDVAPIHEWLESRDEARNLLLLVVQCRCGGDNQKWSPDIMHLHKICQQ